MCIMCIGFFPHEEFFRVFTLMGFSPGLCKATSDLNQLLYVVVNSAIFQFEFFLINKFFLKNNYTCIILLC